MATCLRCKAENPAGKHACWKCWAPLPTVSSVSPATSVIPVPAPAPPKRPFQLFGKRPVASEDLPAESPATAQTTNATATILDESELSADTLPKPDTESILPQLVEELPPSADAISVPVADLEPEPPTSAVGTGDDEGETTLAAPASPDERQHPAPLVPQFVEEIPLPIPEEVSIPVVNILKESSVSPTEESTILAETLPPVGEEEAIHELRTPEDIAPEVDTVYPLPVEEALPVDAVVIEDPQDRAPSAEECLTDSLVDLPRRDEELEPIVAKEDTEAAAVTTNEEMDGDLTTPAPHEHSHGMTGILLTVGALVLVLVAGVLVWHTTLRNQFTHANGPDVVVQTYLAALTDGDPATPQQLATPASRGLQLPDWLTVRDATLQSGVRINHDAAMVTVRVHLAARLTDVQRTPAVIGALVEPYEVPLMLHHEREGWRIDQQAFFSALHTILHTRHAKVSFPSWL